jgi:SAM-dependent methyltransferase
MIYTVQNNASSPRVFYDTLQREITLAPGAMKDADLDQGTLDRLLARDDLILQPAATAPTAAKSAVVVTGHFGIGDNLHQRAVMHELMKAHEVWLHTCHFNLYHDLVEAGLKLVMRPTSLHAQAKTILREQQQFAAAAFPPVPAGARPLRIGYPKVLIDQHGSILEAMFGCVGLRMPERPDFSLPIRPQWRTRQRFDTGGKPLMVHRPVVIRREWDGRSRNPDPRAYDELYRSIREQFFVVSVADLAPGREWIDGPRQEVDVELHAGELSFPELAVLFAEADFVFCNAGFAPVLAQAVGTPFVCVYGGRESYRTTQRVGAHLAPALPIDPIAPCDCHSAQHACDKRIDVPRALAAVQAFVPAQAARTLLFGTFYIDSPDRDGLTELWKRLHLTLNERDCDFLAVDSQSPMQKFADWTPYDGKRHHRMYFNFADNIGHLSRARVTQGRDGWGRAFCKGLEIACELGYQHVAHIEGDSLLRLRVADVVRQMQAEGIDCASTNVDGMRTPGMNKEWIETGLMFFSTDYLKRSRFIERYDWPNRKVVPTPERYIRLWILNKDLDSKQLRIMPWKAWRADKNQITRDNIGKLDLDWITHQHDSAQQEVYRRFVDMALNNKEVMPNVEGAGKRTAASGEQPSQPGPLLKLNLGCGNNKLAGWENHDADIDIKKPLPWPDGSAAYIFIEHCVEHVPYRAAIEFFREALRVLGPGGVLRVTVPSLEQIAACEDAAYHRFTTKFHKAGASRRGAMHNIIYCHGHEAVWNVQMLRDTLYFAGFDDVVVCRTGESADPVLNRVEGHGRIIGEKFNLIESCSCEAHKPGSAVPAVAAAHTGDEVAVVIGGGEHWREDLEEAKKLLAGRRIRYFYVNDQIKTFPEVGVAVTLHPDKLNGHFAWLQIRQRNALPEPEQIWAHRRHPAVTHDTASKEWQGSTGLFAVQVAHHYEKHNKVIACGVPMLVEDGHFERHQKWQSAISFRMGWVRHKDELQTYFRSMSGWTAEIFGRPTEDWLTARS